MEQMTLINAGGSRPVFNRRRVSNKRRVSIKRRGFEVRVLINARSFTVCSYAVVMLCVFLVGLHNAKWKSSCSADCPRCVWLALRHYT